MTPSPAVRRGPRWERPAREDRLPEPATRGNCLSRPDARRSVPAPGRQRVDGRLGCFEAPWGGAPGMPRTDSRPPLGDGRDPEISDFVFAKPAGRKLSAHFNLRSSGLSVFTHVCYLHFVCESPIHILSVFLFLFMGSCSSFLGCGHNPVRSSCVSYWFLMKDCR